MRKPSSSSLLSLSVNVQLSNQQEEGGRSPLMDKRYASEPVSSERLWWLRGSVSNLSIRIAEKT
ncbi:hypothetical protein F2Q70_00036751 [Brassica cretica]|uniref:Uncharacterized protein n=1 Tax=Brassica cretica TaxID=69181 RepID=A0A8S9JXC7_BRACR|nr:hypothetical protein F2Q70_00036751 [Brassica cretica]